MLRAGVWHFQRESIVETFKRGPPSTRKEETP